MTSLWSKFKAKDAAASPTTAAPAKRDPNAPQPTPLELMLADAGPIRNDGSDKFFGFENFGSTCYANSVIQCLYFSVPFRELVINFPSRTPIQSLQRAKDAGLPKLSTELGAAANGSAISPKKSMPAVPPATPGMKPEDKDSPEYKKKQALVTGPILTMDYENAQAYGMPSTLFSSLKDIFEAIIGNDSRIGVVSPKMFLETLKAQNEMFRAPMHQDAHEFLNYLLNEVVENVEQQSKNAIAEICEEDVSDTLKSVVRASLPEDLAVKAKPRNTRWVHELFEGTLTSETRCLTCENTSQRDEPFLDLSVDLEQHSSVTSCLRKFSEEEMLCEKNKFHCDKCGGLQEAEKRMKVKRLPRILALHLKRFKFTYDDNLQRSQKLFHRVVYPYYLRLFNTTDDAEDPDKLYELYAVVVHIGGGPYHGHYVSIIKTQDRGWVLFDDEMVEPVDKSYVRNFFGGENSLGQNALACAYVLFYQETTEEAMRKEQEADGLAAAQKAAEREREAMQAGKVNGTTNGTTVPLTPTHDDIDKFQNLAHAASAPVPHTAPVPVDSHTVPPEIAKASLDHAQTVPSSTAASTTALPLIPKDSSSLDKKAAKEAAKAQAKAEKARLKQQEKDDKAAKKAEGKAKLQAQLLHHKERIERIKELKAKEEDDLARALEESRIDDEKRAAKAAEKEGEKSAQPTRTLDEHEGEKDTVPPPVPAKDHQHHSPANGHVLSSSPPQPHSFSLPKRSATIGTGIAPGEPSTGEAPRTPIKEAKERKSMLGLNRFRQSSISMKGRPKWLPGHGHGHKGSDSHGGHRDSLEHTHLMGPNDDDYTHHDDHHAATEHASGHAPKEKEKKKGVFGGLNRKKSSLLS